MDPRSDIFSFGAVLYEMVTGQRAFRGDTAMSTISAILRDDPEPPRPALRRTYRAISKRSSPAAFVRIPSAAFRRWPTCAWPCSN